jgi:aminoglycoside 2'-N-acetyltransferase I
VHRAQSLPDAETPAELLDAAQALVVESFGSRFTAADWQHSLGGWRVFVLDDDVVVGHAAVVPRRLRVADQDVAAGYVEAVATRSGRHGEGIGSVVMAEANEIVRSRYELGALSTSRHSFYRRLGWESWRGPSYVRDGQHLIRTADEDAGLMVLRCAVTAGLDLTASIRCDARVGDDW